jgi:hypothetical protein
VQKDVVLGRGRVVVVSSLDDHETRERECVSRYFTLLRREKKTLTYPAPVVGARVGEDGAIKVEARAGDGLRHLLEPVEALLRILVPEVERTVLEWRSNINEVCQL